MEVIKLKDTTKKEKDLFIYYFAVCFTAGRRGCLIGDLFIIFGCLSKKGFGGSLGPEN